MNVRLLRKVAKHILAEPKRLSMHLIANSIDPEREGAPPCGTVGCIAGWACILSGESVDDASWLEGQRLLGLEEDEAFRLFDYPVGIPADGWPKRFGNRYLKAKTKRGKANAALARIEHFIKTKGAE